MKQAGQLMMIGLSGLSLTKDEKKFIIENNIGRATVILYNITLNQYVMINVTINAPQIVH